MKYIALAAVTVLTIAACKKSKTDPQATAAANNPATTIDSPVAAAFTPWTDTFKGGGVRPWDNQMISDSMIFFYVYHFTNDSFEISCNATFQYDENNYKGYPFDTTAQIQQIGAISTRQHYSSDCFQTGFHLIHMVPTL